MRKMLINNYRHLEKIAGKPIAEMSDEEMRITQIHGGHFLSATSLRLRKPDASRADVMKYILLEADEDCRLIASFYGEEFWMRIDGFWKNRNGAAQIE